MGFKMKGNPFTTGGIQGTEGHASALKKLADEKASALKHAAHYPGNKADHTIADHAGEAVDYVKKKVKKGVDYVKEKIGGGDGEGKKAQKPKKTTKIEGGTDWEAMHSKAKDKYDTYDNMTTEEYKAEALRQSKSKKETGSYDVSGKEAAARKDAANKGNATNKKNEKDDKNLVKGKEGNVVKTYDKVKTRKDGSTKVEEYDYVNTKTGKKGHVKRKFRKDGDKKREKYTLEDRKSHSSITGSKGETDKTIKKKYDREGNLKRTKVKYDVEHKDGSTSKGRVRRKYDSEGNLVKSKTVHKEGGRRYVKKTKDGVTTTKSRRTLKGWLTGKGKTDKAAEYKKSKEETKSE